MPLISYGPHADYYRSFNPFTLNVLLLAFKAIAFNAGEMNETVWLGITTAVRFALGNADEKSCLQRHRRGDCICRNDRAMALLRGLKAHFQQPDDKILCCNRYLHINADRVIRFYFSL